MEHMRVWLSAVVLHIFQTCGVFLSLTSNPTVCQYVFVWTGEYQHREKRSVCDGTCGSSLIFSIDFLLFSLLHSQGNRCLTWKCPAKESRGFTETNRGWGKKWRAERRKKKRKKSQEGLAIMLITEARADPWPWSWPGRSRRRSEVVWKCHCGDSLHCWVVMILCSLPSLSDMISVALCLQLPWASHPSPTQPHKAR